MQNDSFDIKFQIISNNPETDSLIVRPWSTRFANPISSYPTFNINISNLNSSEDIDIQIARFCSGYVKMTIFKESEDYKPVTDFINNAQDHTFFVPSSAFEDNAKVSYSLPENAINDINFVV